MHKLFIAESDLDLMQCMYMIANLKFSHFHTFYDVEKGLQNKLPMESLTARMGSLET